MGKYQYSDEEFAEAVAANESAIEVLLYLGMRVTGPNKKNVDKRATTLQLDTSHWRTERKKREVTKYKLDEILIKDSPYYNSGNIKLKLIRAGLIEYICHSCGLRDWQDAEISLQLDHINGDRNDHRLENLRLLCPNCHSQTHTYKSGKRKKGEISDKLRTAIEKGMKKRKRAGSKKCQDCNKQITRTANWCKSCYGKRRQDTKIEWPEFNDLLEMIERQGYRATGRELGVSDNAVRKRVLKYS